ncbi:reverse transcriptase domain, reverse transcriptase zinc-binding domain protein [Tanacetum coccineum]
MEPAKSQPGHLGDKIRNFGGKNMKEGKLSAALHGVFPAGSYVQSIDGTIRPKFPEKYSKDVSEIFGAPENHVSTAEPVENLLVYNENVAGASVAIHLEAVEALLHEDFLMFQFNTKEGMESVMENGPWLIRFVPLILNIWTPNKDLKKDVITSAPLWVKLHHVPIVAYSKVGLSLIATQLGKPIMMDSYTSNTYARILVEFSALEELKKSIVIAILRGNGEGHSLATVDIEYEWSPPSDDEVDEDVEAQIIEKRKCVTIDSVKPKVLSPGVNCYTEASESKPRSNIKNNMILPAKSVNKKKVEDHPRKRLYEKGNLHANVVRIRADLDSIPASLDVDPFNATLREAEAKCVVEFNQAVLLEERLLKQKAKVQWLAEGDANSAYFHKAVKSRTSRSRIDVITNSEGVVFQNSSVPDAFVSHYEAFLGCTGETGPFNSVDLFKSRLNEQDALYMVREVSFQEVKDALFSMGDDKSPGPDGFTAAFFKETWSVTGNDVYNAVCEFFRNGTLLKEVNHTIIALLPKVKSPSRINDYRPISCCNVLFKCLSKIIANRIKQCLKHIVSPNQSAFVPGIVLMLELVNLCFADDLFLFAYGDVHSVSIIKEVLDEFKVASGLVPSLPKRTAFFCNVLNHVKLSILQVLPFEEGTLPVKYLGVPLVSSRLKIRDCNELVDRVQLRISDWKNKSLSIVGRLQLIQSVLGSMHIYWASVFMLPSSCFRLHASV